MKRNFIPHGKNLSSHRLSIQIGYLFILVLFSFLLTPFITHADTLTLHPSAKSSSPASDANWQFCTGSTCSAGGSTGYTPPVALDGNDGDSSLAKSTTAGSAIALYMDLDDTSIDGWTINSVQVVAVARATGSSTNIQVGHRVGSGGANQLSSSRTVRSSSYRTYLGPLQATNPSGNSWTWADINNLIAVVVHSGSSSNPLQVTEVFVNVNFSKTLLSGGKNALTTGWTFCTGSTPTCSATGTGTYLHTIALDSNDSDTSYARSTALNDKLYVDLDDFPIAATTIITGVQLNVVARCESVPCNLAIGVRTNNTDFVKTFDAVPGAGTIYATSSARTAIHGLSTSFTTQLAGGVVGPPPTGSQITAMGQTRTVTAVTDSNDLTVSPAFNSPFPTDSDFAVPFTYVGGTTAYLRYTSDFFTRNPATGANWSWNDINAMMGVVHHITNANGLRVTQVYLSVNYIVPVVLSYTPDTGYGSADGVYPESGPVNSSFTYKIVYTNLNGNAPTFVKIHIDNDSGHDMIRDIGAGDPDYSDLDYTNGEQYTYTASSPSSLGTGSHTYYFSASDGFDSTIKPSIGTLNGPGVAIAAGTKDLFPSGENDLTVGDWGFTGGSASTALDDALPTGDSSYADDAASDRGALLYLDMEDAGLTGPSITLVQVSAKICAVSSAATVSLGLRLNGTDYLSNSFNTTSTCGTYNSFSPTTARFTMNPDTDKGWTWADIDEMVGVVMNESNNSFRITEFKVSVTHSPVGLSFASDEPGYGTDGVNPDTGSSGTPFVYKVIYTNANNTPPAAGYPKLYIDGAAAVTMVKDTTPADDTLNNNDFVDGEQYTYSKAAGFASGMHTYYFEGSSSDSGGVIRFPVSTSETHQGPAISLPAGSFRLFPSDVNPGTDGWTFCTSSRQSSCFDPKTALDDNMTTPSSDNDSSYARSRRSGEILYMDLDDPKYNGQFITSVQVKAVLRDEGTAASFTLGLYSVDSIAESAVLTTSPTNTYGTYSGTVYGVNPMTNFPWTWSDLDHLIAVVKHTDSDRLRVSQLYVVVTYGPVRMETSAETGYIVDGVSPETGKIGTSFRFKTVYYQVNNVAPAATPKVHIDGNATGTAMVLDTGAAAELHDGNYTNGEQYVLSITSLTQGTHNYYFDVSDGSNTSRLPAATGATYTGPEVALNGGTINSLLPSGESSSKPTTGWTFCNASPTCSTLGTGVYADTVALDTNDGDSSYAKSTVSGDQLYMELDSPGAISDSLSIISIQPVAVARTLSSTLFDFGLHLGATDFLSGQSRSPSTSYGQFDGAVYTTNPDTGELWTWNDIAHLTLAVVHQAGNEVRVTQLYLKVAYSPIRLTYSADPRYFDDGVDPNGATAAIPFTYRIVYTQAFGVAPAAGYPKVHIDGNATGATMTLDSDPNVPLELRDGDYTNGEQYVYTTTLGAQGTPHNYYFDASDGANTARIPLSGTLSGPVVSGNAPILSFPNPSAQAGYELRSAGTGTLTSTGTNAVTGTGTSFTTQLRVGATITALGGQTRTVIAIASNTGLTVDTPFSPNLSGATFTYASWSGTGALTTTGTIAVTGTGGSLFSTQLQVGSTITAAGQTRTVTAITNNTSLTVDTPFSPNLSGAAFTYVTDLPLRGVEPNKGDVNTQFTFKVVYTDADNNPPVAGYPRLLLDYNTVIYAMSLDPGADPALRDCGTNPTTCYINGEQYTVTVTIPNPGTHAYSFDATDGVAPVFWPLDGDGFLAPSVTDSNTPTVILSPASRNGQTTGFTFQGSNQDPSTALDTNDGDASYARGTRTNDKLYMNMDDANRGASTIQTVQAFAVVRDVGTSGINFVVGTQNSGTDYTSLYSSPGNGSYATYAGPLHGATNPKTGLPWTWNDIANLIGTVKITQQSCSAGGNCREIRVTRMYIQITYNNLSDLSYSPEAGYFGIDGVDPDGWNQAHIYTYKVVYSNSANLAPASLQVVIDGTAYNMIHDGAFITNDPLRNGDYTDGEQFYYSTAAGQLAVGPHTYYFQASDGTNSYRLPSGSLTLPGPNVSVEEPFLTLSSDAGFGTDGLNPNSGESSSQLFTYKVVYTHPNNNYPIYVKVHIDGNEHLMTRDTGAGVASLRDCNTNASSCYSNGEQYTFSTALPLGNHTYLFEATDGAKQVFLPVVPPAVFSGPAVIDSSPPSAITNLSITARSTTSTTLTWTAPGNASTGTGCPCGTVVSYRIRYSTLKIVDDGATPGVGEILFSNATPITDPPKPQPAGATETYTVTGLNPNTSYYFAIKSTDEVPSHLSPLSNVVNGTGVPIPSTNLLTSWNIVSVPLQAADVATVFGSSVGLPVNIKKWDSTGIGSTAGTFVDLLATNLVQPGVGYFLESLDDASYLHPSGTAVSAAAVEVPLEQGWNIVGNPYTKDILLSAVCMSRNGATGTCNGSANGADFKSFANAVAAGWVTNALYQWDGTTYSFQTYNDPDLTKRATLRVWQGYWLQLLSPGTTYKLYILKP